MKRFYKSVAVELVDAGWRVMLDGRPIKTQGRRPQQVPTRALAEAMAAEWAAQGAEIEPATFFLRDLADYAIDMIAADRDAVIGEIVPFAETDTLCYRADPDEPFHRRQCAVWDPLLTAAEQRHGLKFERVSGIIHHPQPPETLAALRALLEAQDDFTLAALKTLASLAASLVIGLAALDEDADAEALWNAANLEEDWQVEQWGSDYLAEEVRARRLKTFTQALRFITLLRDQGAG